MRPFVESELIRTPLEEICLQCKRVRVCWLCVPLAVLRYLIHSTHTFTAKLKLAPGGPDDSNGIPAFLSKAMTPPHS